MSHAQRLIRVGSFVVVLSALALPVAAKPGSVVIAQEDLKWAEAGVPGVSVAVVDGDTKKGPGHFFLRYAKGLVTPLHHHSADHHVTTLAGTLVLAVDGAEHRLGPGSYFRLTGKAPHVARCEGEQDCVLFVDTRGRWDVVPEVTKGE